MFNILFTAVGRRVELIQAFTESLRKHRVGFRVFGTDCAPALAPATHFTTATLEVPRVTDPDYIGVLLDICQNYKISAIIPLYEPEFKCLDEAREDFLRMKTQLILSNRRVIDICRDKYQTYLFFKELGVKTPETWLEDFGDDWNLPVFVKPRSGMGSYGAQKVTDLRMLRALQEKEPEIIIQEYIAGTEYTLDVLNDFEGKTIAVVPRERLEVRSGEVSKSRTVKRPDLIEQGRWIAENLGAIGPITVQCIDTGRDIYWIEINSRLGGGVPLAIRAGVDYPYLIYRMCTGQPVEPMLGEFQDNLTMLRYDQAVYL